MLNQQQHIQELAYYLWLSEGKPDGQSERHWKIATKMAQEEKDNERKPKRSVDPSEAKGTTEPSQPDQT